MSMTGLPVFDETVHATNTWLHEITSRCDLKDRQQGYRLMRVCLHTIRDAISVNASANLTAQLPMLMRGIYYEGWEPASLPKRVKSVDEFLSDIDEAFSQEPDFDSAEAFLEFISVMAMHISEGEMDHLRKMMPDEIKPLWEDYSGYVAT